MLDNQLFHKILESTHRRIVEGCVCTGFRLCELKKDRVRGIGIYVVQLAPSRKVWFVRVKKIFHPFDP
ncbi:hypothetical protein BJV77DRAFT_1033303 [Russula vinacea]|nr:hypothetical protein BJV77DRAFT_1033303 [Russula vinacea]